MIDVKRYEAEYTAWNPVYEEYETRKAFSVEDDNGRYVLYSDYSALQAENERLKADAKYYAELHEPQHRQALEERDQFKAQLHSAEQRLEDMRVENERLTALNVSRNHSLIQQLEGDLTAARADNDGWDSHCAELASALGKALRDITLGEWYGARAKQTVVNGLDCANKVLAARRAALSHGEHWKQVCDHPEPCFECSRIPNVSHGEQP